MGEVEHGVSMAETDSNARVGGAARVETLAKFYLGCIEAEQAAALALRIDGNYLEARASFVEEGAAVSIPDNPGAAKWCANRLRDDPQGLVALGWPVCVGPEPQSRELSVSPLLVGDARVFQGDSGGWRCERAGGGVDLNPASLSLLGFSAEDRLAIETAIAQSVAVDEAEGRRERAAAILRELTEHGVEGLAGIGASPPVRIDGCRRSGVVNAAILLPPASSTTLILNLARDLRELADGDGHLGELTGAASVFFGGASPKSASESVDPTPTVGHSSVQQDRAVYSAMTNPLTVVTGPPGSGKSQVVLNAVAAAVYRGETVLIASKNNKAVDVVVERLRVTAPLCPVVRAGAASQRQALASDIDRLVGEAERAEPAQGLVDASDQWHRVHRQVRTVHETREERLLALSEMQSLEGRLASTPLPEGVPDGLTEDGVDHAAAKVSAALRGLHAPRQFQMLRELDERARRDGPAPEGVPEGLDPSEVKAACDDVGAALRTLARRPGLFVRRRTRQRRMSAARSALERFGERVPHLRERGLSSLAQLDPGQPELGAAEAHDRFDQVAAVALDVAKRATTRRLLDETRADVEERMAYAREALAVFGDCAPHLRERAEACLASVDPLAPAPGVHEAGTKLDAVFKEASRDAASVADRKRRETLRERLDGLPDVHDSEDSLWALSEQRSKAGLALFRAKIRQMQTDRPEAWQAAGRLASRIQAAAKGNARVSDVHALVPQALTALPVWSITNLSARGTLPLIDGLFDLVVIDEASQCDAASAMPLLVRGKRAMVIGDEHQLPHITTLGEQREGAIAARCGLGADDLAAFGYRTNSCFGVARSRLARPPIMLDLHFRSHPAVVEFSNRQFYAGRMTMCGTARPPVGMSAIEWVPVSGRCERGAGNSSWQNRREAAAVAARVAEDLAAYRRGNLSVGVVTPFAQQAKTISSALRREGVNATREGIEIATAHRFQGDERDVIYLSPVIDEGSRRQVADFAADPNLLNVALTRARCRIVIVGSEAACRKHPNHLRALAEHVAKLATTAFDSPLERDLHAALRERGIEAEPGVEVRPYRLDLAVRSGEVKVDIECDGAPFHGEYERDDERDRALWEMGWSVVRFSGRRIRHRLDDCVREVVDLLASDSARSGTKISS